MCYTVGILFTLVGVLLTTVSGHPQDPAQNSPGENERTARSHNAQSIPIPQVPLAPNCLGSGFPGSPNWNACFQKFHSDMANFNKQMQIYNQRVIDANSPLDDSRESHSNNGRRYTTSSSANGFSVRTTGIPVSIMTRNSLMYFKLNVGNFNSYAKRVEGKEILVDIITAEGEKKYVALKFPEGVKPSDIKFDRSSDSIMITTPSRTGGGGGVRTSSSSSSGDGRSHVSHVSSVSDDGTSSGFFSSSSSVGNNPPPVFPFVNPPMNPFFRIPYFDAQPPMWFF